MEFTKYKEIKLPVRCLHYKYINGYYVPCGKCILCRKRIAHEWAFRIAQEAKYKHSYNILLTYAPEHLPFYKGEPSLNKQHVIDFLKRIREHLQRKRNMTLRYFICGEYGGKFGRPHYHAIFFTDNPLHEPNGDLTPFNQLLLQTWAKGIADCEPLRNAGGQTIYMVQYMLGYSDCKEYDKFNRPFRMMSKNPPLGSSWIEDNPQLIDYMHKNDDFTVPIGKQHMQLPRTFKRKIMTEEEKENHRFDFEGLSTSYHTYITTLGNRKRKIYSKKLKNYKDEQKQQERDEYRSRKIH